MEPLNEYNRPFFSQEGTFQAGPLFRKSMTMDFFESLYSFPPKIKLRWSLLDEFNSDLLLDYNYDVLRHSFPFVDFVEDFMFSSLANKDVEITKNTLTDYVDGFKAKQESSRFYQNETNNIQNALKAIPAYVILNGREEIVLAKSLDYSIPNSTKISNWRRKLFYKFCGSFDGIQPQGQKLGFFFMNRVDAEKYLEDMATNDDVGTELVGLSINCVGLDTAYDVMREYHPDTDFRLIPDVKEVKTLLLKNLGHSDLTVDEAQQQVRFRVRSVNLIPRLSFNKISRFFSPLFSLLQRNEYFKGVPIFLVQISETPRSIQQELFYKSLDPIDTVYGRFIQMTDFIVGFGQNWLMESNIEEIKTSENLTSYIFFNKEQASIFAKNKGRNSVRHNGSRTANMQTFVRKPKVFVSNLEDFIELWEESLITTNKPIQNTIFTTTKINFVPTMAGQQHITDLEGVKKDFNFYKNHFKQNIQFKYKIFTNFVDFFLSAP